MDARGVVERYYEYANAGDWDRWCDLFTADAVVDEQLAGRVEGRETLRAMMRGFPDMYATFRNEPRSVVVDGDGQAAVVSRIAATAHDGSGVVATAANYFRIVDGLICYMANFHDTVPFRPVLGGAS
jgi:ketosteroid isomerase-like protein